MSLLRIDASILGPASAGSELADLVVDTWAAEHPQEPIVTRHLGTNPLPAQAWADAVSAGYAPEDQRTDGQKAAVALAAELRAELTDASQVVLASPFYNFGVSQHLKTWIDLVIASGDPSDRLLEGKKVVLLVTRGGAYGAGTPREGWDHMTDYLRRILVDVWGGDVTVVEREFTLVGVNPALDQFKDLGAELKANAHEAAREAGKSLAAAH
ncbi:MULTISPECIES: NAD(P)H-dependent oxidoreductase [unclassified Streptomyces]|uniref:FMN-dependent NADH-azoreductase n=1 Tax=unclassified Streptomyces TaxID=2593676 RepID=UPI000DBA47F2|nr:MULTISPECIES: NAD(P)H-dependent oxidoreductase [unclassified Streptomyces]MYT73484.1 flavodoxin family protein [Streptomyces sp. SID8367]RAJ85016.1 FMN-dependent NADH-azoreductase [Streptomyces sp. PsTaAH-137]